MKIISFIGKAFLILLVISIIFGLIRDNASGWIVVVVGGLIYFAWRSGKPKKAEPPAVIQAKQQGIWRTEKVLINGQTACANCHQPVQSTFDKRCQKCDCEFIN